MRLILEVLRYVEYKEECKEDMFLRNLTNESHWSVDAMRLRVWRHFQQRTGSVYQWLILF